jgi:maltose-binding protein MalE
MPAPTPTSATNGAGALPGERPTTLVFWHAWPSPEQHVLARLVDRYNQSRPDTHVVLQAMPVASLTDELRVAALVGSGPHLVLLQSHTLGPLVQEGLLLALDESMVSPDERADLLPTALSSAHVLDDEGALHLYGLPITFDTLALYYHGAHLSEPPATTALMLDHANRIADTSSEPRTWGMAYTLALDNTIAYLPAFGGYVFDEEGTIVLGDAGRAGTERWLQWLLELRQDEQVLAVSDSIAVDSALKAQQAFMTIDWSHALADYRALWADNLVVAMLPYLNESERPPRPYVQSDTLSINARVIDDRERQAALDFARYLLSPEAQQALLEVGKQPALLGLQITGDTPHAEAARIFRAQALQGQAMPDSRPVNEMVRTELYRMQLSVLRGLTTPAEAVTDADTVLRQRLGELGE